MLGRALIVTTGVLLGFLAALGLLIAGVVVELSALDERTGLALLALAASAGVHGSADLLLQSLAALWRAALGVCFAPVALAALLGEAARLREPVWYAGVSGAIAAAVPTLARAALDAPATGAASGAEGHLTLILFLAGAGGGFVHWIVAGRRRGHGETAA